MVNILLCIAQPTLAYVHTLGNIGLPRTCPNQCTAFCISIASSLLGLNHNYGQAASLCQFPQTHFLFLHTHTWQTARANNGHSSMNTSNKHIEHSTSCIYSLKAIGHLVVFFWCGAHTLSMLNVEQHTCNEHIEH